MTYVSQRKMITMPMMINGVIISPIQPIVRFNTNLATIKTTDRKTIRPRMYSKVSIEASLLVIDVGIV